MHKITETNVFKDQKILQAKKLQYNLEVQSFLLVLKPRIQQIFQMADISIRRNLHQRISVTGFLMRHTEQEFPNFILSSNRIKKCQKHNMFPKYPLLLSWQHVKSYSHLWYFLHKPATSSLHSWWGEGNRGNISISILTTAK